ncbi:mechanosensitive ion channel family protein [Zunongwangia sp. HGR-M22]|uniref:mechanosensitive ion channel family protein n=1 Tax=Zunongwangia sp. HGR-M22 TaxID=3015168 RepID=UPI0022DE5795|nr:mechanosensitive ion channel domain-containing protein [Zunongwangia sp. HGR-M22]WBL27134.1 mechanosensitive ion channel [Zunongwangia sp. HGR-M22]
MSRKLSISKIFIVLFLLNYNFVQAQQKATEDSVKVKKDPTTLPSNEKTVPENGNFGSNAVKEYNQAYYVLNRLNNITGLAPTKFNLQTPQAALEHFIIQCRNENYEDAAYALNLNLLPDTTTKEQAATLAEKLYFVINQRVNIRWDDLPDRPDGQIDVQTTTNQAVAGKPRRSIVFGEVELDGRDIIMRVQRVKYKDYGAFWLISQNTVENIDAIYAEFGPRKLDRIFPDWARIKLWSIPIWKFVSTLIIAFLCYFLGRITAYGIRKLLSKSKKTWIQDIATKLAAPAGLAVGVLTFYLLLNHLISFAGTFASSIYALLLVIVISSITWFFMRIIDYFMLNVAEKKIGDTSLEENTDARRMLTYISVARRVATFIVIIVGASIVLSQFRSLEKLGISLLASAGVATVILGIAAQSTLGNIIAGIQIAITKPARIGDTVIIEDNWGYVEDIRFTYMIVRTWDWRRIVVPLQYVISNTFENWSITAANQIRPITLYADYRIDVGKVRKKFKELLEASDDWDEEKPPVVQVSEVTENAIKIRCLCSAKDAFTTWDLHCSLREDLVRFIADLEDGEHLATSRVRIQEFPHKNK